MESFFKSNLKYLREKSNMKQMELAETLDFESSSAISEWEKGLRIPSIGVLSQISIIFNVTMDDLMNRDLRKHFYYGSKPVPILGNIAAGSPTLAEENIEEYIYIDGRIKADFALNIKGDSMIEANINEGDVVFIRKQDNLESGEIGAILVEEEATLKRFYKKNDSIILYSENKKYEPMVFTKGNIKILGKLVAVLNYRN